MQEALHYEKRDQDVLCVLCPHFCTIREGHTGLCCVRRNTGGVLYTLNYGKITSIHADPVEKKPLIQFMPNTYTLSLGSFGCNLACPFCQNHTISKGNPPSYDYLPEEIIEYAIKKNYPSISYTYSEPSMFYEFMLDTAKLARDNGLKNIMVTNGYLNPQPLAGLLPYMDAMNIDLKTYDDEIYRKNLKGSLQPVMDTIEASSKKCHVEVTMLVVPGISDDLQGIEKAAIALSAIDENIPLHLSRYFPRYQYSEPATDLNLLENAYAICRRHLKTVVLGNV